MLIKRVILAGCGILLAFAGCRDAGDGPVFGGGSGNALEEAAIERGVIVDAETSEATGLYARNHTSGSDGFCLIPDGSDYKFAASISFGADLFCEGQGVAERDGSTLALKFDAAPGCVMGAEYQGNAIKLDATMPDACKPLCSLRGSFAGAELRRVGWTTKDASQLASKREKGAKLCAAPASE